jgi:hypothetical protein
MKVKFVFNYIAICYIELVSYRATMAVFRALIFTYLNIEMSGSSLPCKIDGVIILDNTKCKSKYLSIFCKKRADSPEPALTNLT